MTKTAVLLVNMGGPDALDDVEPYLQNIFSDPHIFNVPLKGKWRKKFIHWFASGRAPKSRGIYSQIGNKSPLIDITRKQSEKLEKNLNQSSQKKYNVFPAMQYWNPLMEDVWKSLGENYSKIIVVSLYPYYSTTTTLSIIENAQKLNDTSTIKRELKCIDRFGADTLFLEAVLNDIHNAYENALNQQIQYTDILFSAHSIPYNRIKKGDPYEKEIRESVALMKPSLPGNLNVHLSFQSKVGPVKWLSPASSKKIPELAKKGVKNLMVYPLGFVADNSETIYEIDIEYRKLAKDSGIVNYCFIEALNTSDVFIKALKQLILEK